MTRDNLLSWFLAIATSGLVACSASGGNGGGGGDGGGNSDVRSDRPPLLNDGAVNRDISYPDLGAPRDVQPNPDAYFAMDPAPEICYADGGMSTADVVIGGTVECPADKNREGCPCTVEGEMAPCWPGLRTQRNRGICRDGMTRCTALDEVTLAWGACQGVVLPAPGATMGAAGCGCFSAGEWHIDNLSPCVLPPPGGATCSVQTVAFSSIPPMGSTPGSCGASVQINGSTHCIQTVPPPPTQAFSTDTLTVDCAGQYTLCFTIKAGDATAAGTATPSTPSTDCTVAHTCVTAWYDTPGMVQNLPPLPSWTSQTDDPSGSCTAAFYNTGGYAEMSVVGTSMACETLGSSTAPYVFQRITYCPLGSNDPNCTNGATGGF